MTLKIVSSKVPQEKKEMLENWIQKGVFKSFGDFMRKAIDAQNNGNDFSKPLDRMLKPDGKVDRKLYDVLSEEGPFFVKWDLKHKNRVRRKSGVVLMSTFKEHLEILKAQGFIEFEKAGTVLKVITRYRKGAEP